MFRKKSSKETKEKNGETYEKYDSMNPPGQSEEPEDPPPGPPSGAGVTSSGASPSSHQQRKPSKESMVAVIPERNKFDKMKKEERFSLLKQVEDERNKLSAKLKQMETQMESEIISQKEKHDTVLKKMSKNLQAKNGEIEELKKEVEKHVAQHEQEVKRLKDKDDQVGRLQEENKALEKIKTEQVGKLQEENEALEKIKTEHNEEVHQLREEKREVEQRAKKEHDEELKEVRRAKNEQIGNLQEEIEMINGRLKKAHQETERVGKERDDQAQQLKEERRMKEKLQEEKDTLKGQLHEEIERMKKEHNDQLMKEREEGKAKTLQIKNLQDEKDRVKGELEQAQKRIEEMDKKHDDQIQRVRKEVAQEVREEVTQKVREEVAQEVREEVAQKVREEVAQEVREEVVQKMREEVAQEVREEVAQEVREEVTKQVREEVAQEVREEEEAKSAVQIERLEGEVDQVKGELEQVQQQFQSLQAENDKLKESQRKSREERDEIEKQVQERLKLKYEEELRQLKSKLKSSEGATKKLSDKLTALRKEEEAIITRPLDGKGRAPLETSAGEATATQLLDLPSNVTHFSYQLSKLVDPEGQSIETSPRPIDKDATMKALQAIGIDPGSKPRGYVVAVFHALNHTKSVLLDYTSLGEVAKVKGRKPAGVQCVDGDDEMKYESPLSSLDDVKLVADGNITDADKIELQKMLSESQKQLRQFQEENKKLTDDLLQLEEDYKCLLKQEPVTKDPAGPPAAEGKSDEALKGLKRNYLKIHDEKLQLLQKLEERDAELKELRTANATGEKTQKDYPSVERSLSIGEVMSPEDPRAEVDRLRHVIEEKEMKVDNLNMQLQSFQKQAKENVDLSQQIAGLMEELMAMKAENKILKDSSELAQVTQSLSGELTAVREQLNKVEKEEQDLEDERDVWKKEIEAEKENNSLLQAEVARLTAALQFLQLKDPSGDSQSIVKEMLDQSEDTALKQRLYQIEVKDLESKIARKEETIKSVTSSRNALESRLQRMKEERDRLAQQNITLLAVKANLKGELSHFDEMKHNVEGLKKTAAHFKELLAEAEGLKKEKEALSKDIEDLKDEVEARKIEVAVINEDFQAERRDREGMARFMDDKAAEWNIQEQKLNDEICGLKEQVEQATKLATHISEQQQYQLDAKLGSKERELAEVREGRQHLEAHLHSLEENYNVLQVEKAKVDEILKQLKEEKQRQDAGFNEIRKENQYLKAELDRMKKEYQDLKTQHETLEELLNLEKVAKLSAMEQVAKLDDNIKKKEKLHEITALEKREIEEKVRKFTQEFKQERDKLLTQMHKVDVQRQRNHDELEVAIADTARLSDEVLSKTQQVKQYKKQADGYKVQADGFKTQLQEERMKIQELEQRLHYLQESLHNQNEEHKEEVEIVKAQCMSEKMDLERVMVPMQRELEQLRSQKMGESQYAESFKRIESEKRELQQKIAELERKNNNLMDSLTEAREVLIQKNLPLPKMSRKENVPLPPQVDYAVRPYNESQQPQPFPPDSREPLLHRLDDYPARRQFLSYSKTETHNQPPSNRGGGNMQPNQAVCTEWQGGGGNAGQQYGGQQIYPPSSPGRKANQKPSPPISHIPRAMEQQNRDIQGSQFNPRQQQQQLECNAQLSSVDVRPYQPQQPHMVPPPSQQAVASNVSCDPVTQDSQGAAANLPQENVLIHGIDSDIRLAAAAVVQSEEMEEGMQSLDARPLDSNLVCPLCKRQFRIGQIQLYRDHVDNCKIKEMARQVQEEVSKERELVRTIPQKPYDPNLVCPLCAKMHRIGEIQKFRAHVDTCKGQTD